MSMSSVQPSGGYNVGTPFSLSSTMPIDDRQMSRLPTGGDTPWPPPELSPVAYMHRIWDALKRHGGAAIVKNLLGPITIWARIRLQAEHSFRLPVKRECQLRARGSTGVACWAVLNTHSG